MSNLNETAEQKRLNEARDQKVPWKKWGPYLSERQWGTVREDYSDNGDAWSYFSHEQRTKRKFFLKLRSLRTDPNPPEEWISLSVEKEVLNRRVRTGGLPPGYIDQ